MTLDLAKRGVEIVFRIARRWRVLAASAGAGKGLLLRALVQRDDGAGAAVNRNAAICDLLSFAVERNDVGLPKRFSENENPLGIDNIHIGNDGIADIDGSNRPGKR